jgi:ribosomal protein S18 acetylase RimI-like enzyme
MDAITQGVEVREIDFDHFKDELDQIAMITEEVFGDSELSVGMIFKKEYIKNKGIDILVAEVDGKIAGFIILLDRDVKSSVGDNSLFTKRDNELVVYAIGVDPKVQKRGVAKFLYLEAMKRIKAKGKEGYERRGVFRVNNPIAVHLASRFWELSMVGLVRVNDNEYTDWNNPVIHFLGSSSIPSITQIDQIPLDTPLNLYYPGGIAVPENIEHFLVAVIPGKAEDLKSSSFQAFFQKQVFDKGYVVRGVFAGGEMRKQMRIRAPKDNLYYYYCTRIPDGFRVNPTFKENFEDKKWQYIALLAGGVMMGYHYFANRIRR